MTRSVGYGCALLTVAALLVGCGASQEEKLVKDQIALVEQMADAYEKVKDKKSYKAAATEAEAISKKMAEVDKELSALGKQRREAALKSHAEQVKQAETRMSSAKEKAAKFAS